MDFGKVLDAGPLVFQILKVSKEHDVFQLAVVEVTGAERHDETAEADEWRVIISEYADYDMVAQVGRRRLYILQNKIHHIACITRHVSCVT